LGGGLKRLGYGEGCEKTFDIALDRCSLAGLGGGAENGGAGEVELG